MKWILTIIVIFIELYFLLGSSFFGKTKKENQKDLSITDYNMREKARIKRILRLLEKYWLKYPELRLGQLIMNLFYPRALEGSDIFYVEDKYLETLLKEELRIENKFCQCKEPLLAEADKPTFHHCYNCNKRIRGK
jgi:hypothetical protein